MAGLIDTVIGVARKAAGIQPARRVDVQFGPVEHGKTTADGKRAPQQPRDRAEKTSRLLGNDPWTRTRRERYQDYREMDQEMPETSSSIRVIVDFVFGCDDDEDILEDESFRVEYGPTAHRDLKRVHEQAISDTNWHKEIRRICDAGLSHGDEFAEIIYGDDPLRLVGEAHRPPETVEVYCNEFGRPVSFVHKPGDTEAARDLTPFQMLHYAPDAPRGSAYGRARAHSVRGLRRMHEAINDVAGILVLRKASGDTYFLWPMPAGLPKAREDEWIRRAQESVDTEVFFERDGSQLRRRVAAVLETVPKIIPFRVVEKVDTKPVPVEMKPAQIAQIVELLKHLEDRVFVGMRVPKALVGVERDVNARSTLEQQGIHFVKSIRVIKKDMANLTTDMLVRAALVAGIPVKDGDFKVVMPKSSVFDQKLRAEVFNLRAASVQSMGQVNVPPKFAMKMAFGMTDEQLAMWDELDDGQKIDLAQQKSAEAERLATIVIRAMEAYERRRGNVATDVGERLRAAENTPPPSLGG